MTQRRRDTEETKIRKFFAALRLGEPNTIEARDTEEYV